MIKPEHYIRIWKNEPTLGVKYSMVRAAHTEDEYANFCKWMCNQTVGVDDKNEAVIYSWDYERFCREGMKTKQNAETWD
jgi:hypothetical protein